MVFSAPRNSAKTTESLGLGEIFVSQVPIYVRKTLRQGRKNLSVAGHQITAGKVTA